MLGTRNGSDKLASTTRDMYGNPPFSEWLKEHNKIRLDSFSESAAFGEIIVNATLGSNSLEALNLAGDKNISEKILIDVSNPLDFSKDMPPSLLPGLNNTNSLGEEIQKAFPSL